LARSWLLTEAVIERITHLVDPVVLKALVQHNVKLDLSAEETTRASADRLIAKHLGRHSRGAQVRRHSGTLDPARRENAPRQSQVGLIDEDLLLSGDFMQLRRTAETLADLFGPVLTWRGREKAGGQQLRRCHEVAAQ
jgi:DNA gyrase subunit B